MMRAKARILYHGFLPQSCGDGCGSAVRCDQRGAGEKLLLEISEWELARESYDSALLSDALNRIRMLLLDEQIRKLNEEIANVSDAAVKAKLGDEKML